MRLLEHNVRFGDPECQCLMMRLQSDLLEVLLAAAEGRLGAAQLQWSPEKALSVRRFPIILDLRWRNGLLLSVGPAPGVRSEKAFAQEGMPHYSDMQHVCRWCWRPKATLAAIRRGPLSATWRLSRMQR